MNHIKLQQALPEVFADRHLLASDIWEKDIDFEKGKHYLLEAASGTGKSSFCSFIYGYRADYRGTISFDDKEISSFSIAEWIEIRRKSLSLLFQDLRLFPELTAMENVRLKNDLTGFKTEEQITALFNRLHIADKIDSPVGKLSFGQQQRVAFIRCLCQPYDFIVLDEPISHLDDANSEIIQQILIAEASAQQAGIIVTSIGKHLELNYNHIYKL